MVEEELVASLVLFQEALEWRSSKVRNFDDLACLTPRRPISCVK